MKKRLDYFIQNNKHIKRYKKKKSPKILMKTTIIKKRIGKRIKAQYM